MKNDKPYFAPVQKNPKKIKISKWKQDYKLFLQSEYWNHVRQLVLVRDGYRCKLCHSQKKLHIHHKTYKNHFNEHKNLQDLVTLCEKCHKIIHNKTKKLKKLDKR